MAVLLLVVALIGVAFSLYFAINVLGDVLYCKTRKRIFLDNRAVFLMALPPVAALAWWARVLLP